MSDRAGHDERTGAVSDRAGRGGHETLGRVDGAAVGQSETDDAKLKRGAADRLVVEETLGVLETDGAEEFAIVGLLETDEPNSHLASSKRKV